MRLEKVTFRYGTTPILDNISLECQAGKITILIGPSACGKTTLLNVMAGLSEPTSGYVERQDGIGYVFQSPSLLPWRTVEGNAMLGFEISNGGTTETKGRMRELIGAYGLRGFERAYPSQLSGGMQQRVAIIRAIVAGARVLLLDEPFSDSDFLMRRALQQDLSRAVDEESLTAVLVTHDLAEAVQLGDKVIVLTQRPARVVAEIEIPIPRKERFRHKWVTDPELMPYLEKVWAALATCETNETAASKVEEV